MPRTNTWGLYSCNCGCGGRTDREFCPGHDARHRGNLLRLARTYPLFTTDEQRPTDDYPSAQVAYDELNRRHWLPSQHGARRRAITGTVRVAMPRNTSRARESAPLAVAAAIATFERRFGVEIECKRAGQFDVQREFTLRGLTLVIEGYNHSTRSHWKIVPDGSVHGGFEVVSPPLAGEAGMEELRKACEALAAAGAKIDRECGLHVHHDAPDMTPGHVARLLSLYAANQANIDAVMPPSRRQNRFCWPWSASRLERAHNARTIGEMHGYDSQDRYYTVNVASFQRHGTIEFRQHSGSIEFAKISRWVRLGQAMIAATREEESNYNHTYYNVANMARTLGLGEQDIEYWAGREQRLSPERTPVLQGVGA